MVDPELEQILSKIKTLAELEGFEGCLKDPEAFGADRASVRAMTRDDWGAVALHKIKLQQRGRA